MVCDQELLVVIFDVNSDWWSRLDDSQSAFERCVEQTLVFCNSYLMLNHTNRLAFIACHTRQCKFLYPTSQQFNDEETIKDGKHEFFVELNETVTKELKKMVASKTSQDSSDSLLAGALAKALCYISATKTKPRVLIIKGSADVSSQYMPIMNCIFAAQKKNVVIDCCALYNDSGYLQQAADITNGVYFKVQNIDGLLEHLLWTFLPNMSFRQKLNIPASSKIDYRAACFCHKQLVDVGFVCSVCLSIYCQFMPKCATCQTRFKLPALPSNKFKQKRENSGTVNNFK